jgi:diguanylate cyclase (GGDEF)-like protein
MVEQSGPTDAIERLALLACTGRPATDALVVEVLALVADSLSADAVVAARLHEGHLVVERLHDLAAIGLRVGDAFAVHDRHFGDLVDTASGGEDGEADVHFESLVLARSTGVRACSGIPLYRSDGGFYGRLCVLHPTPRATAPAERSLLRLAGRIVMQVLEQTAADEAAAWRHHALHDALTSLPNRLLLEDRFRQALATAERDGTPLAVLMIDLDGFKAVNDAYGHHAGDEILRQLGPRLHRALRESDTMARVGGDEFVALLPRVDAHGAALVARKILRVLRRPFAVRQESVTIWASIGIAVYPEHGRTAAALWEHADTAMYECKGCEGGYQLFREPAPLPNRLAEPHR